ncbi:MAG: 16S rRNA (uracil(1498)-N(3))-methyltransferase [Gemmatimonadota bacterium]
MPRSAAPRFYLDGDLAVDARVSLPAAVAHHAQRVLRLRDGDAIVLFNGRGGEYAARIGPGTQASIERYVPVERESPLRIELIQALIANDKLDWVVEKAVELGADSILVAPATRSVVRLDRDRLARRLEHWRETVVAACCQCGRNRLPKVSFAATWDAALSATNAVQRFLLAPNAGTPLASATAAATAIAVGPEGGFTTAELELARQRGFVAASWGPRVLRTETAGLAALVALQTLHGDAVDSASWPTSSRQDQR